MNDQDIRRRLQELHDELQRIENVDEEGRALLRRLDEDIRLLLQRTGEEGFPVGEPLLRRLQSAIDRFELSHPKLTMALSEMLTSLSNAGI